MNTCRHITLYAIAFIFALTAAGCQFAGGRDTGSSPIEEPGTQTEQGAPSVEASVTAAAEPVLEEPSTPSPEIGELNLPETETVEQAPDNQAPEDQALEEQAPDNQTGEAQAERPACEESVCIESGTFLLNRPIDANGRYTIDYTNRFGKYQSASKNAHHGVEFLNSLGTPVLAAAGGSVVVAGDDSQDNYGYRPGTYGNLVILEHQLPGIGKPVYTLYAHLSEVLVDKGDSVVAGQEIGKVSMTGRVQGSTLHFEVRHQENTWQANRNPELWLEALMNEDGEFLGSLAGRIIDGEGKFIAVQNIVLEQLAGPGLPALDQIYLSTYAAEHLRGRPPWRENFAAGDLPAGDYQLSFWLDGMQQLEFTIEPGKLTVVTIVVE